MELSSCPALPVIEDSGLTEWEVIGSGGFGEVYKARHHQWCCNVAIKRLKHDDGTCTSLLREIQMMRQASSPYVIQVLGMFKGRLPSSDQSTLLGLVMEVMESGSLAALQATLRSTKPWPLVFRLAHQVALGVNFLHSLRPALLHLDLKPSNVLLDSSLNAKLTDFGLSRFSHSNTRVSKRVSSNEGGTLSYMPPEAFDLSYSPTRASDIYSYGILLWSLVTGKKPYPNAMSSMVRFRIPQGDRPLLDEIWRHAAGLAGLTGLMSLMERCWDPKPNQRPSSHVCTTETEELFKMHKHSILDAVHQVLKRMNEGEQSLIDQVQRCHITPASAAGELGAVNIYDVPTGPSPVQETVADWTANQTDHVRFKDRDSPQPARMCDVDLGRSSTDRRTKASSVQPVLSSQAPGRSPRGRPAQSSQQAFRPNVQPENEVRRSPSDARLKEMFAQRTLKHGPALFERQFSSPGDRPRPAVHMHLSNVTGFQQGNNNIMHIYGTESPGRKRHPTAPSSVNLPPPNSRGRRNKTGGVG